MLGAPDFMLDLQCFDKSRITASMMGLLKPIVSDQAFSPEAVKKKSVAVEGLCRWVIAHYSWFNGVNSQV